MRGAEVGIAAVRLSKRTGKKGEVSGGSQASDSSFVHQKRCMPSSRGLCPEGGLGRIPCPPARPHAFGGHRLQRDHPQPTYVRSLASSKACSRHGICSGAYFHPIALIMHGLFVCLDIGSSRAHGVHRVLA